MQKLLIWFKLLISGYNVKAICQLAITVASKITNRTKLMKLENIIQHSFGI